MKKLCLVLLLFLGGEQSYAQTSFINGITHGKESITCDLPGSQHIKNIGSKVDGSGMCVFTSIEMAALHAGLEQMRGFRNWVAEKYAGGGWPDKVDKLLADRPVRHRRRASLKEGFVAHVHHFVFVEEPDRVFPIDGRDQIRLQVV